MIKTIKAMRIKSIGWIAARSPCLAMRWGLQGIVAAEITGGPHKGRMLGVAMALDNLEKAA